MIETELVLKLPDEFFGQGLMFGDTTPIHLILKLPDEFFG